MKNKGTQFLVEAAAIGAIYVVLTVLFAPLSYGEVQIRFCHSLHQLQSRDYLSDVSSPIFLAARFR